MTARNTEPASSMTEPTKCQTSPCGLPRMLIVTASALTRFLRCGDGPVAPGSEPGNDLAVRIFVAAK